MIDCNVIDHSKSYKATEYSIFKFLALKHHLSTTEVRNKKSVKEFLPS